MYLKFLSDFGSWKKDDVSGDVPSGVARSFVEGGIAEEVNAESYLRAMMITEMDKRDAAQLSKLQDVIKTALKGGDGATERGHRPAPPNGGGHVDYAAIAAGKDPNEVANERQKDRAKKGGGMGDIMRCVAWAGKPHVFGHQRAEWATRRLQGMSDEAVEYRYNDDTGEFTEHITRQLAGGGVETITRTGTDSLSGGATYGFAVKPEYLGNIFEISMEQQVFVNAAQQIPVTQGLEVRWPAWDQYRAPTTAAGVTQAAVFAGIQLYYLGETTARVATDAMLNSINFKIVDLTAFTALSRDFVVDNYLAFDSALTRMIGRAFGWMEDYMAIQGPGVGKPLGYFNGGSTLVVNRTDSSKIEPIDLTTMISKASPMVWNDLRWITNITTIPYLAILQDHNGTYVFQPNALINQAMELSIMAKSVGGDGAELMHRPMGTLLGFPVYFSEKVPTLGNTGDLSLVAPRQFGVASRSGLEIAVSEHFYFSTDLIAYRLKRRHDMKPLWRGPYQQADGSSTNVAPFVILH